jgi:membrane-bound lytic murein transglycosylase D
VSSGIVKNSFKLMGLMIGLVSLQALPFYSDFLNGTNKRKMWENVLEEQDHSLYMQRSVLGEMSHRTVQRQIEYFSAPHNLQFIVHSLERAAPYLSYIMERIDYYGLPRELLYLPVIESAYRPAAVSPRGALGVWQFMATSATPYGLQINEWQDDRRDIYLATDAALRKIKHEYSLIGDMALALAAYNGGLTRVRNAVKKAQAQGLAGDFWTLQEHLMLPYETMQYVPKIMAVAHIVSNGRDYGIEPVKWITTKNRQPLSFGTLVVDNQVNLHALATHLGVEVQEFTQLNSGLRHGITPPQANYQIRVPHELLDEVRYALEKNADALKPSYRMYTVQRGDTLSGIAHRNGVTVSAVMRLNPKVNPQWIHPGQTVLMPYAG